MPPPQKDSSHKYENLLDFFNPYNYPVNNSDM